MRNKKSDDKKSIKREQRNPLNDGSEIPDRNGFFDRFHTGLLLWLKSRAPRFWRKHWGYPVPQGERFEDYCENLKPTTLAKDVLGRAGERFVFERIIKTPGNRALACNVENYYCEIDVVFLDERTKEIVFVEVKTRRYDGPDFRPENFAIDARRKKKLALAGRTFMRERGYVDYKDRYDVAVVITPEEGEPTMRYYKGFFNYFSAVRGYRGDDFGKKRSVKYLREDLRNYRRDTKE